MFKGINAMSNLGYDPLRPDNPTEMVFSVVVMVYQIAIEAYILGKQACILPFYHSTHA